MLVINFVLQQHAQMLCALMTGDSPPTLPTARTRGSEIGETLQRECRQ